MSDCFGGHVLPGSGWISALFSAGLEVVPDYGVILPPVLGRTLYAIHTDLYCHYTVFEENAV